MLYVRNNQIFGQKFQEVAWFLPHEDGSPLTEEELKDMQEVSMAAAASVGAEGNIRFNYEVPSRKVIPFPDKTI